MYFARFDNTIRIVMRLRQWFPAMLAALLISGSTPQAQDQATHGGGFDKLPLSPPPLLRGIGSSEIIIPTSSAAAQNYFNQGLRLLHCFWDFETYRAFQEPVHLDDSFARSTG